MKTKIWFVVKSIVNIRYLFFPCLFFPLSVLPLCRPMTMWRRVFFTGDIGPLDTVIALFTTENSAMEIRFLWRKQFKFRKTLVPLVGSGKQTRISLKRLSCVTFSDIYNGCCLCCYMVPHCNSDRPPGIHSDTVTITNFYH